MAKSIDVLTQLKNKRASNLTAMASWVSEDFIEMLNTYQQAKEIAFESNESDSVAILDEKISQLKEALALKSGNASSSPELNA